MRTIDPAMLEPDQLAFCIETNGAIDARRFVDFLECFGNVETVALPLDGMDILELSNGSFFGKLRIRWNDEPSDEDRLTALEAEFVRLRGKMEQNEDPVLQTAKRGAVASEIAAAAARRSAAISLRQYRESVKGRHIQYYFAAVATATLMLAVWEKMSSPDPNPCAEAASAIMDLDGAPRIHLWTHLEQICVHRQSVGHDPRGSTHKPHLPVNSADDNPMLSRDFIIDDTADADASSPAIYDRKIFDPAVFATDARTRLQQSGAWNRRMIEVEGMLTSMGDAFHLEIAPPHHGLTDVVVLLPDQIDLRVDHRYRISGDLYQADGEIPVLTARQWEVMRRKR
ncbi:hypothetical protein [Sphingopyxis sp. Root1497]|uniref:hypothetical protein n=1 Tax=Sphingopyxis sp. Root1497 TaxID=1736474 RepID=UPI0012E35075|nr:hypothetical protein [Sphingopyxis sp. Root1497]